MHKTKLGIIEDSGYTTVMRCSLVALQLDNFAVTFTCKFFENSTQIQLAKNGASKIAESKGIFFYGKLFLLCKSMLKAS